MSSDTFLDFADLNTNECLENNGGCWQDKAANITACRVSFWLAIFYFIFLVLGSVVAAKTDKFLS